MFMLLFACWCHEVFIIMVDIGQWHAPNNKGTKTMEITVWFYVCADEGARKRKNPIEGWQQASGAGAGAIKMRRLLSPLQLRPRFLSPRPLTGLAPACCTPKILLVFGLGGGIQPGGL